MEYEPSTLVYLFVMPFRFNKLLPGSLLMRKA